jgi:hypothetical protein
VHHAVAAYAVPPETDDGPLASLLAMLREGSDGHRLAVAAKPGVSALKLSFLLGGGGGRLGVSGSDSSGSPKPPSSRDS